MSAYAAAATSAYCGRLATSSVRHPVFASEPTSWHACRALVASLCDVVTLAGHTFWLRLSHMSRRPELGGVRGCCCLLAANDLVALPGG